jgi:hypothetical protein
MRREMVKGRLLLKEKEQKDKQRYTEHYIENKD